MTTKTDGAVYWKERWASGETAFYEYHCFESDESCDAKLWRHSHQEVTVLSGPLWDGEPVSADEEGTFLDRGECGEVHVYKVRFADGYEYEAFEDELNTDPAGYYRPDPPRD